MNQVNKKIVLMLMAVLWASTGLATQKESHDTVLVKNQNSVVVTVADILSEANKMPSTVREEFFKKGENIRQVANNLMIRRVLAKEAEVNELLEDPVVQAGLAVAKDRVLSDLRLLKMDAENAPDAKALEAYARNKYQANISKYKIAAQTRASHILIEKTGEDSLNLARSIRAKIKTGAKFEDMVKEYSKDPGSAQRGGDLGFFGEGRMVKPFEEAVKSLGKPGDISEPVESQFGYHIIRLDERQAEKTQTFAEVRDQLTQEARSEIMQQKRLDRVKKISADMQFDAAAIEKLGKEASAALSPK
jgi:peptidyl-prolyl cis-trans isomerase C